MSKSDSRTTDGAMKNRQLPGDTVILGFTGSIGSGCTYIAEGLAKQYAGFKYYSLSDILRTEFKKANPSLAVSIEILQDFGNKLRTESRDGILVEKLISDISVSRRKKEDIVIILDSIRNDGEVATLKQFPFFYLFSIHADQPVRKQRTLKIKKVKDEGEFNRADERDQAEDVTSGQQVKKCNYLADIIVNNNENIPESASNIKRDFLEHIYKDYIRLILECKHKGHPSPENLPKLDETLMTMAYAESQRSSCLKRKVGAIIARIDVKNNEAPFDKSIRESVNVLSNGHNQVPLGTVPCAFYGESSNRCYRDFLQESQASRFKFCPVCGKPIEGISDKCKRCGTAVLSYIKTCPECKEELDIKYRCGGCNTEVFKEFLQSGGRLLDMCRSLHAEENALLNTPKPTRNGGGKLVLFTTTYPCNMCANKIVEAGIEKVIYADPYPMGEAKDILRAGRVEEEKFEGIKSSAYFRLYK